ncbi:Nuclease-related domain-containing protein [Alkalibacterium subtropicum]|uniref:Nuclease-related domain-containing protein n=1 Tax=Alkalibacterium subtropicum TaxID=753702 RepID=A0A1I1L5H4_9LACT|nr:nuclease-related domain-containing protein [Alkalibacterium subtropicum]SFC68279.1 Nuclease-related domain-containing protein [Alkalibacterium subtropicum]
MKIIKKREKSKLLIGLNYLDKRTKLNDADKRYLISLEKGFEGEERFDALVKTHLNSEALVVNDLLIESKGNTFQIDALIVTFDTIYLYEIKNYKGDFQMNSGQLSYTSGQEITNPLIQLKRTKELLRQLLKDWGMPYRIEAHIVFINDAFTLYNASLEDPIIFPTQLKEHLGGINARCRNLTKQANHLANKLVDRHQINSLFHKQLPSYRFEDLRTGASCPCGSFDLMITQRACYCKTCYKQMSIEELVLESVKELKHLFPDEKLTTALVNDFCGQDVYYRKIRSILQNNFSVQGTTQGAFYK